MAKTTAERQALYRATRKAAQGGGAGQRQLNLYIAENAHLALKRLAAHHQRSQREILEQLLLDADEAVTRRFQIGSPAWNVYFDNELAKTV